jgi:hypothetical protein
LCHAGGPEPRGQSQRARQNATEKKPAAQRNQDAIVTVRLRADERDAFAVLCAQRGMTVSAGVRRLVRAADRFSPSFDGEERDLILKLTAQWQAIGTNLNQTVKAIHGGRVADVSEMLPNIARCRDQLHRQRGLFVALCAPTFEMARRALAGTEPS